MAGELVPISGQSMSVPEFGAMSMDQCWFLAEKIAESGMFGIKTPAQAFTLMAICVAEGKQAIQAVREYHIMGTGKPTKRADAMLAEFRARGGKYTIEESSPVRCAMTFSFDGTVFESVWTWEDAIKAELTTGPNANNWRKYPRNMLRARAISDGVRTVMPGVVVGIYTPEEEADIPEDRNYRAPLRAQATAVSDAPPKSDPEPITRRFPITEIPPSLQKTPPVQATDSAPAAEAVPQAQEPGTAEKAKAAARKAFGAAMATAGFDAKDAGLVAMWVLRSLDLPEDGKPTLTPAMWMKATAKLPETVERFQRQEWEAAQAAKQEQSARVGRALSGLPPDAVDAVIVDENEGLAEDDKDMSDLEDTFPDA